MDILLVIALWATIILVIYKIIYPRTKKLIMYLMAIGFVIWYHKKLAEARFFNEDNYR